jgi:hypothetical protein
VLKERESEKSGMPSFKKKLEKGNFSNEWPWARHKGKFSISCIHLLHFISCITFKFSIKLIYIAWLVRCI